MTKTEAGTNSITEASKTMMDNLLHVLTKDGFQNIQSHVSTSDKTFRKKTEGLDLKQEIHSNSTN